MPEIAVETWDGAAAKGIDDALAAGVVTDVITGAAAREHVEQLCQDTRAGAPALPEIVVSGRFRYEITADAADALRALNVRDPHIFRRASEIVRVLPNHPSAEMLGQTAMSGVLDRAARFLSVSYTNGVAVRKPARPPGDMVGDLMTWPGLTLPELADIRTAPVYLPDGRLLSQAGYDAGSGIYLMPAGLDGAAADMDPAAALWLLTDELLSDFPYTDDAGRAHTLALLLQPFVRPLIDGPTPLYLIDAPARGTGKGLLADVAALITLGHPANVMTLSRSEEELDKRVTALLVSAAGMILLDNVTELRSAVLCAALTTTRHTGRYLGLSRMVTVPNLTTWLATGNNVALSDEMTRRVVPIRLDAGVERPEERGGWRHPNLLAWVRERRGELVSACLSLVRAWINTGMPAGTATLGRYQQWAAVMGGILNVAGVPGLLGGRERLHSEADAETQEWAALCAAWWGAHTDLPVTAGDLLAIATQQGLLLDILGGRSRTAALQRIGHALKSRPDRVFGGFRIRHAGRHSGTGNQSYRLQPCGASSKTPETPETPAATPNRPSETAGVYAHQNGKTPAATGVFAPADSKTPAASRPQAGVSGVSGVFAPAPARVDADTQSAWEGDIE